MKRKAFDAGLPWDLSNYIIRMDVYVRDHLTQNELHHFHLQLCSRDNIDTAKYMLSMQIWERIGRFPKLSSFQLKTIWHTFAFSFHRLCYQPPSPGTGTFRSHPGVAYMNLTRSHTHNMRVSFPKGARASLPFAAALQTIAISSTSCTRPRPGPCVCVCTSLVQEIRGSQPIRCCLDRFDSFVPTYQFSLAGGQGLQ